MKSHEIQYETAEESFPGNSLHPKRKVRGCTYVRINDASGFEFGHVNPRHIYYAIIPYRYNVRDAQWPAVRIPYLPVLGCCTVKPVRQG